MCRAASAVVATNVNLSQISVCSNFGMHALRDLPVESGENDSCDTRTIKGTVTAGPPALTPACSNGDKSGKPEDHGDGLNARDGKLVGCLREAGGRQHKIGNGQQSPYRGEEHKAHARRSP